MARFFDPIPQYLDDASRVLPGAKLFFYENGTTTPQDTFSDAALTTPNPNPVVCDAAGRIPPIFVPDDNVYSITFTDSDDVQFAQIDDYVGADSVNVGDVIAALAANTGPVVINGSGMTVNQPLGVGGEAVLDADFIGSNSAFRMDLSATDAELRATNTANSAYAQMTLDALNYSFRVATNEWLSVDGSGNTTFNATIAFNKSTQETSNSNRGGVGGAFYLTNAAANPPVSGAFHYGFTMPAIGGPDANNLGQIAMTNTGGSQGRLFWRTINGGSTGGWLEAIRGTMNGNDATFNGDVTIGGSDGLFFTASDPFIGRDDTNGSLIVSAGTRATRGANHLLYGATHTTAAYDWRFRTNTTTQIHYDHSAGEIKISSADLNLQSGDATVNGDVAITGSGNNLTVENGPSVMEVDSTTATALKVKQLNSGMTGDVFQVHCARSSTTAFDLIQCGTSGGSTTVMKVLGNGNLENANNSYGALSDIKLKQDIELAGSQVDDIRKISKIVSKYRMREQVEENPDAHFHIGLIAQDLEKISAGLIETKEDMEWVEVEPAQEEITELQPLTWQKPVMVESTEVVPAVTEQQAVINEETGEAEIVMVEVEPETTKTVMVQATETVTETVTVPEQVVEGVLIPEHEETREVKRPLFTTENVVDENGEIVMRPVVVQEAREAVTEQRLTGEVTKSVKYSILYMKAVKALGELIERVEALEAK